MTKSLQKIVDKINVHGRAYFVGGWVRDTIMGRVPGDVDILAVGLSRELLHGLFPTGEWTGESFPVLRVDDYEIALARTERKVVEGHTGFECDTSGVTLEEDLARRDFTINAIAMDPITGDIIDPFNGREDISRQQLMPVSLAFREDPLRTFRMARFAATLQFNPSLSAQADCEEIDIQDYMSLPGERVFQEMLKAFKADKPSRFFETLNNINLMCPGTSTVFSLLELWFPELARLVDRPQVEKYHPEGCCFTHTMLVLDRARELGANAEELFAALCHDLGKGITPDDNLPHHYNHEELGVPLVHDLCDRLRVPTRFRKLAAKVTKYHMRVHRIYDMKTIKRIDLLMALKDHIVSMATVCQADAQGRGEASDWNYQTNQAALLLNAWDVVRFVKGDDLATLKDGKKIAEAMRRKRTQALDEAGYGKS